jgi:hypothetical protein
MIGASAMSAAEIIRPPLLYSGQRLSRDEFYRRVEQWERTGRNPRGIERLEGVVYMPAAAIRLNQHCEPQFLITTWLGVYKAATPGVQGIGSATSKLDDDNDPEGDALLRIHPDCGGQSRTDGKGYIVGAPELVVEITGSSSQRDLELKLEIYRRNGVQEYVVWETLAEEFYWFVLESGECARLVVDETGMLRSRVFPGLWLDSSALLAGDLARVLAKVQEGLATPEHAEFVRRLDAQRQNSHPLDDADAQQP